MAILLLIETSANVCSVALARNGKVLALKESNEGKNHASLITLYIDEVVKQSALSLKDIDAVSVNGGPGSYTSLRIGLTTAKGLCFALDIPLIMIDAMSCLCSGYLNSINKEQLNGDIICTVIDNRRDEIFYALFNSEGKLLKDISLIKTSDEEFIKLTRGEKVIFTGSGVEKIRKIAGEGHTYITNVLSAIYLLEPSEKKYRDKDFANLAYSEPLYYKEVYIRDKTDN